MPAKILSKLVRRISTFIITFFISFSAMVIGLAVILMSIMTISSPSMPPVLDSITAQSLWDACGVFPSVFGKESVPIKSSEGLLQKFPIGTNEDVLIDTLTKQGFSLLEESSCKDAAFRQAIFKGYTPLKNGRRLDGLLCCGVHITVAWKADEQNKIVWISGNVAYLGP